MIFTFGIFFLQVAAHAADRSAGAHAANEVRDLSFRVFPDFRAGRPVMRLGIHRIFVLVRVKRIRNVLGEFFRHGIVAARIVGLDRRRAHDHFRAERLQQIHFFLGLLVGDGEHQLVAAHRADQREADPGVARGSLDDRAAGLQQALSFGIVDHRDADAVLHRAARIHVIGLDVHFGGESGGQPVQAHQRRVSDGVENVVAAQRAAPGLVHKLKGTLRRNVQSLKSRCSWHSNAFVRSVQSRRTERSWQNMARTIEEAP